MLEKLSICNDLEVASDVVAMKFWGRYGDSNRDSNAKEKRVSGEIPEQCFS